MFKKKVSLLLLNFFGFVLLLSECTSIDITSGIYNGLRNTSSIRAEPFWARDPYTKYDRQTNVVAVGRANSREMAEKNALGNLVAIFGQNIQIDEKVSSSYREAVKKGITANWSGNTAVDTAITTSAGMASLIGVEILDRWDDGRNFYATAVMNKANALQTYSDIVISNLAMIEKLVNIPEEEKNTLNGFARYQFAATIADMTASYVNLLSFIGGTIPVFMKGDDYRLEATNITKAIPVGLNVHNDKAGRIHGAFARALSDLGFSSGGSNPPYLLDVDITATPVVIANSTYKFTRIELKADLKNVKTGIVLLPYNFNNREGHSTQEEADNRAYAYAEQKINEEYLTFLKSYLYALLPN